MRVQLTQNFADNTSTLHVAFVIAQTHVAHRVQNATLNWLKTITSIWQGSRIDDGVGVFQERALHLGCNVNINYALRSIILSHALLNPQDVWLSKIY